MITYYRVYFDSEDMLYVDVVAGSTEEALQKVLSDDLYADRIEKLLRAVPLKLYKAVLEEVITKEVELYAEDEANVKQILKDFPENLYDYGSTVDLSIDSKTNIKSIEEE